jgi:hypothetical protein
MAALSGVEEAAGGPVYSSAAKEASCSSTVLSAELSRIFSHISDPILVFLLNWTNQFKEI